MTGPRLPPARIEWSADGPPRSLDHGDVYHPRSGAREQARQVFLQGNGLPGRWQGRQDFVLLETGFGLGHNFLTTWQAWLDDPDRPARLHYVAIESRPPTAEQLQRAHAATPGALAQSLIQAWPPRVAGLHRLDFDAGQVRLLLALGDVGELLPQLSLGVDAFCLDGFAPTLNPEMWDTRVIQALGRRARPGATLATWCVARSVRDALDTAGFHAQRHPGSGGKREVLRAVYRPRPGQLGASMPVPAPVDRVVVVGAGLAGASCASALAALGVEVEVLEQRDAASREAWGEVAGLFHGTVHGDDGPYARLHRAAALHTRRMLARLGAARVPHQADGLLRLETRLQHEQMQQGLDALGLPPDLVQALDAAAASALAGVDLRSPAWLHRHGGWVSATALVKAWLDHPRIHLRCGLRVDRIHRAGCGWQQCAADGTRHAEAPQVVLAVAGQLPALLDPLQALPVPLQTSRGQVTLFDAAPGLLRLPVAGGGYALQRPDGTLLCGATRQPGDDDPAVRDTDHRDNLDRLQRLCGIGSAVDLAACRGRVGWRTQPSDRLPLAGPLPALRVDAGTRLDQPRRVPREPGLHLLCGLGARGLTLAPLLGELVAARIAGTPLPLEQSLVDLVDPARWCVRRARRAAALEAEGPDPA